MSGFGVKSDFLDVLKNLAEATDENDPIWQGNNLGKVLDNIVQELKLKGDVFLSADQTFNGTNTFDLTSSDGFFALDTPDPQTVDPTYGVTVFAGQTAIVNDEIIFYDQFCSPEADLLYLQNQDETIIGRRNGRILISINQAIGAQEAFVGDLEINTVFDTGTELIGSILANGNEVCAIETGENADGKWEIHYNSKGEILSIEQNVRVVSSDLGGIEADFPIPWNGFEYTGTGVSSDLDFFGIPVVVWASSQSDDDSFLFASADTITQALVNQQIDFTFKGYPPNV